MYHLPDDPRDVLLDLQARRVHPDDVAGELELLGNDNPEVGHGYEDNLMKAAIRAGADQEIGHDTLEQVAHIVNTADFPHWYD